MCQLPEPTLSRGYREADCRLPPRSTRLAVQGLLFGAEATFQYRRHEHGLLADAARTNAKIDLLVTDVRSPGMDGRQMADAGQVVRPGLKTLFTGYAESTV